METPPSTPAAKARRMTASDLLASFQPSRTPRTPQRGRPQLLPSTPDSIRSSHEPGYDQNSRFNAGSTAPQELLLENEKLSPELTSASTSATPPSPQLIASTAILSNSTTAGSPAATLCSAAVSNSTIAPASETLLHSTPPSTPQHKVKAQAPHEQGVTNNEHSSVRSLRPRPSHRLSFNFSKSTYTLHSPPSTKNSATKPLLLAEKGKPLQTTVSTNDEALEYRSRRDDFYLNNQSLFLPLLPTKNYISQLQVTRKSAPTPPELPLSIAQPKVILTTMKDYQLVGLQFLVRLTQTAMAGILADEMGLGKTIQTLALLAHLKANRRTPQKPSLVLCPLSVLPGWVAEAKFHAPSLRVLTLHGPPKERNSIKNRLRKSVKDSNPSESFDLVVMNYETYELESSWMTRQNWDCVVLDEGHKIKNASSKISRSLRTIKSNLRLILTGTPVQNDLKELWALFHWLFAEVFVDGTDEIFKKSFDLTSGSFDESNMDAARELLYLVTLRRTKESPEVDLRLPGLTEHRISLPLTALQKTWYLRLMTKAEDFERGDGSKTEETLSSQTVAKNPASVAANAWTRLMNLLMQLRQICIHPYLIEAALPLDSEYYPFDHVIPASSKFVVVKKLVDEIVVRQNKKLIIFSGFTKTLDFLEELLHLAGGDGSSFKYLRLDGSTAVARRNLNVRLFQDRGSKYQVFLISTRAGGHGLNLQAASDMIFMDEDWNPQITQQAKARCYRIGQDKHVNIYQLATEGTVEAQMSGRILKKRYLSAKITDSVHEPSVNTGEENPTTPQLGLADLQAMINGGKVGLSKSAIDVSEMSNWTLATILDRCVIKPEAIVANADEEAEAVSARDWFLNSERVHTRAFEGRTYQRSKDVEEEFVEILKRADRRIGKNTTVMVDGWSISKESMDCKEWEAVPTLPTTTPLKQKQAKEVLQHQKTCQICHTRAEELLPCGQCPRAYHLSCLSEQPVARTTTGWHCPQHKCEICRKAAGDVGGLLLRCAKCEKAYCEACLAWDKTELIGDTLSEFDALGFYAKNNAFYIHCMDCKKEPVKISDALHGVITPALSFVSDPKIQPKAGETLVEKTARKRKRLQEDDDDVLEISPIQWHNRERKN